MTTPYRDACDDYWRAGWRGVLPLPPGQKWPPPTSFTGYAARSPSYADVMAWAEGSEGVGNIALHLEDGEIGIDVDAYDDKPGAATMTELEAECGPLPPTWRSTSRVGTPSGIKLFKVPSGTTLLTKLPGVELIQPHHRYLVVAPSVHPSGGEYVWINESTGEATSTPPRRDEIPALPEAWLRRLESSTVEHDKADLTRQEVLDVLAAMPKGEPCRHVTTYAGKAAEGGDRHDTYAAAVLAILGAGRRGCPGAVMVVGRLRQMFVAEVSHPRHGRATEAEALAEFDRFLTGAVRIVVNEQPGNVCPDDVAEYVMGLDGAQVAPESPGLSTADDTAPADADEPVAPSAFDLAVSRRYADLRVTETAKEMLAAYKVGQAPPLTRVDLAEFLAQPDEDARYRVDELWPAEGRVLLAAAAKSGKTTIVVGNLIPSLIEGRPFLGRFDVQRATGRIALFNMEVGERTLRNWIKRSGLAPTDQVVIYNLRGRASALTLASESGRKRLAAELRDAGVEVAILDPLAPVLASLGLDENSNADVARFFAYWSEVLAEAGVTDDLVVHHAGHAGERSRGASRLLDEPDAIWTLTRDADRESSEEDPLGGTGSRYLSAYGRDVELAEEALTFDSLTGGLSLSGLSKGQARKARTGANHRARVTEYLRKHGPSNRTAIAEGASGNKKELLAVILSMAYEGEIGCSANNPRADGALFFVDQVSSSQSSDKFTKVPNLEGSPGSGFRPYTEPGDGTRTLTLLDGSRMAAGSREIGTSE